ncbi:MAG TPA: amidase, partial [Thermodesulfobacteriota bacterium]|nr:amidase [Thermodesulfobacteriota bacterium]
RSGMDESKRKDAARQSEEKGADLLKTPISRRGFIKAAGIVGVGVAAPGLPGASHAAEARGDLCFLPASELAPLVQKGEISPVEIVEALLARIGEVNERVKAFIYINRDQALQEARQAEKEIRQGQYRGPLHGIPVAHKDIFDVRGLPTTAASRVLEGYVAKEDSAVAARLRQAGSVCLGKLNLWEFASGSMEVFGDARNPWNTEMVTGGSSSGSAAALAAHLVPLATGTDTGGSVRGPAHNCGIVGLRPSYGRVSRAGVIPLSWTLDHAGPMARTVMDTALLLQAMSGADPKDPSTLGQPAGDFTLAKAEGLKGKRIGFPAAAYFKGVHPEVLRAVQAAVKQMEELGATVQEVELAPTGYGASASWTIAYTEAFAFHRTGFSRHWSRYTPAFRRRIASSAMLSAEEVATAQRIRQLVTAEYLRNLERVDIIVTPTVSHAAFPVKGPSPLSDMLNFLRPVSLTGLPALSVPCGFTEAGLPIGMQLVGRMWEDRKVLQVGQAYEEATDWHKRRAPLKPGPVPPAAPKGPAKEIKVTSQYILEKAKLEGLGYVTAADAEAIAPMLEAARTQINLARQWLETADFKPWPALAG